MPQRLPRKAVVKRAEVSPKVTKAATAAYVISIVDAVVAGDIDPVKFGIAVAVSVFGYFVKDRINFDEISLDRVIER